MLGTLKIANICKIACLGAAVLLAAVISSMAAAEEVPGCIPCKLHGPCPLPSFTDLKGCFSTREPAPATLPANSKAPDDGWVDTPCGRIRSSTMR